MIILLGLVVVGFAGAGTIVIGVWMRSSLVSVAGAAMVVGAVAVAITIRVECDPGCEVGSVELPPIDTPGRTLAS